MVIASITTSTDRPMPMTIAVSAAIRCRSASWSRLRMVDGLEPADALPELLADLGVLDRRVQTPLHDTRHVGGE
jgi:hypothetical protein